jgi:hypothetical protein
MMAMTTSNSIKVNPPGLVVGPGAGHIASFGLSIGLQLEEFIGNNAGHAFFQPQDPVGSQAN